MFTHEFIFVGSGSDDSGIPGIVNNMIKVEIKENTETDGELGFIDNLQFIGKLLFFSSSIKLLNLIVKEYIFHYLKILKNVHLQLFFF